MNVKRTVEQLAGSHHAAYLPSHFCAWLASLLARSSPQSIRGTDGTSSVFTVTSAQITYKFFTICKSTSCFSQISGLILPSILLLKTSGDIISSIISLAFI